MTTTAAAAPPTTARLTALAGAVALLDAGTAAGEQLTLRTDGADALGRARAVLRRAAERRALSAAHTVVALAGSTGGGKSSLANALLGEPRMVVGARRPTTAAPVAGVFGLAGDAAGAGPILDWLEVPHRHVVPGGDLEGLVLVDLPDIDSVELAHQETADRLAQVVDVLVWVLDPQKYADNLLHQRYLRPMATHAAVTVIVLNQADTLSTDERRAVVGDLRRLLADDGLAGVPVIVTSAATGEGLGDLRGLLARITRERWAAEARLAADAAAAGRAVLAAAGSPEPAGVQPRDRQALAVVLAEAAGVEVVADAVRRSYRAQARRSVGWPPVRWIGRIPADPLRRLGLGREVVDPTLIRSSMPRPTAVQRARVDGAVRALGVAASSGAVEPWRSGIRAAATDSAPRLADALDQAIVSTRLDSLRTPRWWRIAAALQWLLLGTALVGALWLGVLAGLDDLKVPEPPTPVWGTVPWPTVLTLGGAVVGLVLAGIGGLLARARATRRAAKVRRRLREAVARVADEVVISPVTAEIERCVNVTALARQAAEG